MDISKIDKNFEGSKITEKNIEWNSALEKRLFFLSGVYFDEQLKEFRRLNLTDSIASSINNGVKALAMCTAGGRIRFTTNSDYIAIRAIIPTVYPMDNMNLLGESGFAFYVDGVYHYGCIVNVTNFMEAHKNNKTEFPMEGIYRFAKKGEHKVEIYLPLYSGANAIYIGTENGSTTTPLFYDNSNRIAFYGSSITQGGCASHPGNDYISILSRMLNVDIINYGFSGSAHGEENMAELFASLPANIFVMDYDHNADVEELEKTHYKFYKKIRDKNPNAPIIFITKPDFDYQKDCNTKRREIIIKTYKTALFEGDEKVEFIDGEKLFGDDMRDACTVDTCHPNDLGFFRMAKYIEPRLKKWLE